MLKAHHTPKTLTAQIGYLKRLGSIQAQFPRVGIGFYPQVITYGWLALLPWERLTRAQVVIIPRVQAVMQWQRVGTHQVHSGPLRI